MMDLSSSDVSDSESSSPIRGVSQQRPELYVAAIRIKIIIREWILILQRKFEGLLIALIKQRNL